MDQQQALIAMSKYVAQAKDLIVEFLDNNDIEEDYRLDDAVKLLNNALENVIV